MKRPPKEKTKKSVDSQELAALEKQACHPVKVDQNHFNPDAELPHGLKVEHIAAAMNEFVDFLGFIDQQLSTRQIERLETMLMPANFSSIVGEFMTSTIPKHCRTVVKNAFHNGHPDMLPIGVYEGNKQQHGTEGIEVKASRYLRGWQGHNPEDAWLMVFCFVGGRPTDKEKGVLPAPFRFALVCGAPITKSDWKLAGRKGGSRRTITAAVTKSGYEKMMKNWIYREPNALAQLDVSDA